VEKVKRGKKEKGGRESVRRRSRKEKKKKDSHKDTNDSFTISINMDNYQALLRCLTLALFYLFY